MSDKQLVWDLPVRVFHWTLAASFAGAYALADTERLRNVHVTLGYTAVGLIAFRLLWGFMGTQHARFASFRYAPAQAVAYLREILTGRARRYVGHNPAGSWAVYALLALGLATGASGYLHYSGIGGEGMEEVHEACANLWLMLVGLHLVGVVVSSLAHRENLVRAMLTGRKTGAGSGARSGAPVVAVGLALAAAVLGFWTWSARDGVAPVAMVAGNERVLPLAARGEPLFEERGESDDD